MPTIPNQTPEGTGIRLVHGRIGSLVTARFIRFLATGVANTAVGYGTIFLLKYAFSAGDVLANASGYAVGLCLSYFMNKQWVFQHRGATLQTASRFLLAFGIAYATNLGVVLLAIRVLLINSYLAQFLGVILYTPLFYLLMKTQVFAAGETKRPLN
jgi:putative flippase GtrA